MYRLFIFILIIGAAACQSYNNYRSSSPENGGEFADKKSLEGRAPQITAVYPTSDALPSNLLRLYIQFSEPMKTQGNLENIRFIDDEGRNIKGVIFNNVYELWDDQQKQLTILMDPARVKSDLRANQKLGRALKPGRWYTLIMDKAQNIHGNPMAISFSKRFFVDDVDHAKISIDHWDVKVAEAGSRVPLQISFPKPLDQMSLLHRIKVRDSKGQLVQGRIALGAEEKSWRFYPQAAWESGDYTILVDGELEDPSGNNLRGLFDHKLGSLLAENNAKIHFMIRGI